MLLSFFRYCVTHWHDHWAGQHPQPVHCALFIGCCTCPSFLICSLSSLSLCYCPSSRTVSLIGMIIGLVTVSSHWLLYLSIILNLFIIIIMYRPSSGTVSLISMIIGLVTIPQTHSSYLLIGCCTCPYFSICSSSSLCYCPSSGTVPLIGMIIWLVTNPKTHSSCLLIGCCTCPSFLICSSSSLCYCPSGAVSLISMIIWLVSIPQTHSSCLLIGCCTCPLLLSLCIVLLQVPCLSSAWSSGWSPSPTRSSCPSRWDWLCLPTCSSSSRAHCSSPTSLSLRSPTRGQGQTWSHLTPHLTGAVVSSPPFPTTGVATTADTDGRERLEAKRWCCGRILFWQRGFWAAQRQNFKAGLLQGQRTRYANKWLASEICWDKSDRLRHKCMMYAKNMLH